MDHDPVMVNEVVRYLVRDDARTILDATVGGGGHASAILRAHPHLRLVGLDRDAEAIALAGEKLAAFSPRVELVRANFDAFDRALSGPIDGALLDLGISSMQLFPERGFSHAAAGPLDMRMDRSAGTGAALWIRNASVDDIADVLRRYGEVRGRVRSLAQAIKRAAVDGLATTADLRAVVESVLGRAATPAALSRVFQAFRIAVNDELGALARFLERILDYLREGARLVVISYHSLEDRAVKVFMKEQSASCVCPPEVPVCACGRSARLRVLTRRVVTPSASEIARNPRARSAKLRAAERIVAGDTA